MHSAYEKRSRERGYLNPTDWDHWNIHFELEPGEFIFFFAQISLIGIRQVCEQNFDKNDETNISRRCIAHFEVS